MEKYAVKTKKPESENEKVAGKGPVCPKCKKGLIQEGEVLLCEEHGSKYIEEEKDAPT